LCVVPGQPTNVRGLCTVVAWQAPTEPNGVIVRYDIQFSGGQPIAVDAGTVYLTDPARQTPGTTVRVSTNCVGACGDGE
jgi:hypothetical protein